MAGDLLVQFFRNCINLVFQFAFIIDKVFGGHRLAGKTHVHNRGRMAFSSRQVYQASFTKKVYVAAILKCVLVNKRPYAFWFVNRQITQCRFVDFYIKMTRIGQYGAIFHYFEMVAVKHVNIARRADENVANRRCFHHRHYTEPIHDGF